MRVLLDECLPRRLKHELPGHDVKTVPEMGWAGLRNGDLLRVAADRFDAFLTVDRSLPAQQRTEDRRDLSHLLVVCGTVDEPTTQQLVPEEAPG